MLRRFSEFKNMRLRASHQQLGNVVDLLIEDDHWYVRYLVVAIDNMLPSKRKILISPAAIEGLDPDKNVVACSLNSQQVVDSPPIDLDQPVSRQYEKALVDYYGWPIYWLGRIVHGSSQAMERMADESVTTFVKEDDSSNLRSAAEICGYQIHSCKGKAGHLKDLVIQTSTWMVEYATADPSSRLPHECGIFSARTIENVDWANKRIDVKLPNAAVEGKSIRAQRKQPV